MTALLQVAILSLHSNPLGRLGSRNNGGMSVYIMELATRLALQGHGIDIFTTASPRRRPIISPAKNIRIIQLPGSPPTEEPQLCSRAIIRFCRDHNLHYDVIHSNYYLSGVAGEHLGAHWSCSHIITFHTLEAAKAAALPGHRLKVARLQAERHLLNCCDVILAPTSAEEQRYVDLVPAAKTRILRLGGGVDLNRFTLQEPRHKPAAGRFSPRLLFVGRFDPMKGLEDLLDALSLRALPDGFSLTIAGGEGPGHTAELQLHQLIEDRGLAPYTRIVGPIPNDELPAQYNGCDLVVVPSRYESFGLVALEALACGTPVAATRTGIAPDIIIEGTNGALAEPGNPQQLADAISRGIKLAGRISRQDIRHTVRHCDWDRVAKQLSAIYYTGMNTPNCPYDRHKKC